MCFGGDDPPQAPNNAPTYSTDEAKAASAAATIAKDPAQDDDLTANPQQAKPSQATKASSTSGAAINNLRM